MNDANMDESIYMDVDESIHTACESDRNLRTSGMNNLVLSVCDVCDGNCHRGRYSHKHS